MDLVTFSKYIKDNKDNSTLFNFDEFSKHYKKYKITNRQLNELRENFFIDQLKTKLDVNDYEWETDQSDYVNNYKKELDEHSKNFRVLIDELEAQIGKINVEYEKKSKKYKKQIKKVDDLKTKIETQIEIKTGYENVLKRFSENNNNDKVNNSNIENEEKKNNYNELNKDLSKKGNQDEKKHKKSRFMFIRNKSNVSEYDKLQKKLQILLKDIDTNNKALLEQYKKLDKKKMSLEKVTNTKEKLKKQLNDIVQNAEKIKKELLQNLSEKLKLTAKFVSTNQY
jgi:chromosome segregation ATPase